MKAKRTRPILPPGAMLARAWKRADVRAAFQCPSVATPGLEIFVHLWLVSPNTFRRYEYVIKEIGLPVRSFQR